MLKLRLQGTLDSIAWFCEFLENHSEEIDLLEVSEVYANRGNSQYSRVYIDLEQKRGD